MADPSRHAALQRHRRKRVSRFPYACLNAVNAITRESFHEILLSLRIGGGEMVVSVVGRD